MSTLATGLQLPQEDGDSNIWDNKLNVDLTMIDTLLRQMVDLQNNQFPIGTIRMIPDAGAIPAGWEQVGKDMAMVGAGSAIRTLEKGGTDEWNTTPNTGPAGSHQHPASASHQHAAAGAHTHGSYIGNGGEVALIRDHLPAVPLPIGNAVTLVSTIQPHNLFFNDFDNPGNMQELRTGDTYSTENMGSGAGHAHAQNHEHSPVGNHAHPWTGSHAHSAMVDHAHSQPTKKWACAGRWIRKIRELNLADLQAMTEVS